MTLTKVTSENTPFGCRMKWRMESTSGLVPSKTLTSILDIVPSSSEDITRAMRGQPKRLS